MFAQLIDELEITDVWKRTLAAYGITIAASAGMTLNLLKSSEATLHAASGIDIWVILLCFSVPALLLRQIHNRMGLPGLRGAAVATVSIGLVMLFVLVFVCSILIMNFGPLAAPSILTVELFNAPVLMAAWALVMFGSHQLLKNGARSSGSNTYPQPDRRNYVSVSRFTKINLGN